MKNRLKIKAKKNDIEEADKILRLLTPEEIEKYNSIMTAKNYNL